MSDVEEPTVASDDPAADEDLESAYRRALEAMETAETAVHRAFGELQAPPDPEDEPAPVAGTIGPSDDPTDERTNAPPTPTPVPDRAGPRATPLGIIEAALFVGGTELVTKKLVGLLNGEFDADRIAGFVDELNARYQRDGRPYEIQFGEGGYRLALRTEFDEVRNRVFGLGPREVKLSQPALEMLSLVAYRQPIDRETIETHGGKSGMAMVRQLVRRRLVEVVRDDEDDTARYRTTDRFLEVFGIAGLDELPRAVELEMK